MKKLQTGFTLIELLVVIAIIGILSSIVLASLSSARSKGTDASIQSSLSNMRPQAELFYSTYGGYATSSPTQATNCSLGIFVSTETGGLSTLVKAVAKLNNDTSTNYANTMYCRASSTAMVVAAKTSTGYICVDSTGLSKASTTSGFPGTESNFIDTVAGTCK